MYRHLSGRPVLVGIVRRQLQMLERKSLIERDEDRYYSLVDSRLKERVLRAACKTLGYRIAFEDNTSCPNVAY